LLATLTSPALPAFATADVPVLLHDILWGETSADLVRQFGAAATRLLQPLDFGDSYVDVVLHNVTLGGVPVAVFFQMDKATKGLKRVQLQPLGHEINPPAYRAIRPYRRSKAASMALPAGGAGSTAKFWCASLRPRFKGMSASRRHGEDEPVLKTTLGTSACRLWCRLIPVCNRCRQRSRQWSFAERRATLKMVYRGGCGSCLDDECASPFSDDRDRGRCDLDPRKDRGQLVLLPECLDD
jgi:hypothetical protein